MSKIKEIKERAAAFKHWHRINPANQISSYDDGPGPDIEWLINRVNTLEKALLQLHDDIGDVGFNVTFKYCAEALKDD